MNPGMYSSTIIIDANRADDDEHWRIERIHMVLGYAQALADINNNEDFHKKIQSLYDHKGTLTVAWNVIPTDIEKEYLQKAWQSAVTNYEGNPINHIV